MGLQERLLMQMDRYQRVLLVCVLGLSLVIQISTELYYLRSYHIRILHFAMLIGVILLLLNPKGVRLLLFGFFTFLLIDLLREGSFSDAALIYALPSCLYGLTLMWVGASMKLIIYIHIGLYAALAYFSFKNPFAKRKKNKKDSELIDRF